MLPSKQDNRENHMPSLIGKTGVRGRCILIIDDDLASVLLLEKMLKVSGATVATFQHGRQAIEWALVCSPDLIITDIHMPEINGIELIKELRFRNYTNPIIAISSGPPDPLELTKAKCSAFLAKPLNFFAMLQQISLLLATSEIESEIVASPEVLAKEGQPGEELHTSIYVDDPIIQPLIKRFLFGLPNRFKQLQYCIREQNHSELTSSAHQLKGALLGYGFTAAGEVAATIERMAKSGSPLQQIQAKIDLLVHSFSFLND